MQIPVTLPFQRHLKRPHIIIRVDLLRLWNDPLRLDIDGRGAESALEDFG